MKYKRQILKKVMFFSIGTTSTKFQKKTESVPLQQNFKKNLNRYHFNKNFKKS